MNYCDSYWQDSPANRLRCELPAGHEPPVHEWGGGMRTWIDPEDEPDRIGFENAIYLETEDDQRTIEVSGSSHILHGPLGLWYVVDMLEIGPGMSVILTIRETVADYEEAVTIAEQNPPKWRRLTLRQRIGRKIMGGKFW